MGLIALLMWAHELYKKANLFFLRSHLVRVLPIVLKKGMVKEPEKRLVTSFLVGP